LSTRVLILPGIGNSGPEHWQSRWEASNPSYGRVMQRDWENPVLSEWQAELEKSVGLSGPNTILLAHSLASLLAAHWATSTQLRIKAALLVAVPDPARPTFPSGAAGFAPFPQQPLPFKSLLVASTNDPYGSLAYSRACASLWGSQLVVIGDAGHINSSSGLGMWEEGHNLLRELMA
jgi:predicted alpha/beta hydrolase family esterase